MRKSTLKLLNVSAAALSILLNMVWISPLLLTSESLIAEDFSITLWTLLIAWFFYAIFKPTEDY